MHFFIAGTAVLCAAVTQVLTGFGFALVAIPLLMYVFPGYEAVLISMVLSVVLLGMQIKRNWKIARWDLIWRLTMIGLAGLVVGASVSDKLNAVHLKSVVGAAVLIYVLIQWIQVERNRRSRSKESAITEMAATRDSDPLKRDTVKKAKARLPKGFYVAGLFSGLLIGVVGMPGPPVVAVLVQFLKKDVFRATVIHYFLINYFLALAFAFFIFHKESQVNVLLAAAGLIIPLMIGYIIGQPISKFVHDDHFQRIVFSLLIIVGLTAVWPAIASL